MWAVLKTRVWTLLSAAIGHQKVREPTYEEPEEGYAGELEGTV